MVKKGTNKEQDFRKKDGIKHIDKVVPDMVHWYFITLESKKILLIILVNIFINFVLDIHFMDIVIHPHYNNLLFQIVTD